MADTKVDEKTTEQKAEEQAKADQEAKDALTTLQSENQGLKRQLTGKDGQLKRLSTEQANLRREISELKTADLDPEEKLKLQNLEQRESALVEREATAAEERDTLQSGWITLEAKRIALEHPGLTVDELLQPKEDGTPRSVGEMESLALRKENANLREELKKAKGGEGGDEDEGSVYDGGEATKSPKSIRQMTDDEVREHAMKRYGIKV